MPDVRYCPSCGSQVSVSERFCGNCGARMDQPASVAPTLPLAGQAAPPTQVLPSTQPPGQPSAFNVPPGSTALPPRRGLPIWVIILLSIGALAVVGCIATVGALTLLGQRVSSVFATTEAGLTTTSRPSGQGGGIVPVATRRATTASEVPSAATSESSSTGGGIVGGVNTDASIVRTAEAATVESLVATAQAQVVEAEVAALIASGKQIFSDDFVDNRNAWFTGVFEEIETDKIEDGVFKVIWSAKGTSYELYEVKQIPNFIAEVDCLIYQGGVDGSCGLVFDQKNDVGFYKFEIFHDYYRLFVVTSGGDPTTLAEGDPAGIINADQANRLRVIRQGEQIQIFLNGNLLNTVSDGTYQTGKIGISTNSYSESGEVEVWFDNFVIWELPG